MSDLLNSASLVMIPSGYKEDVVYSQIPTDGSGDLSFSRASNGTRVNSAGLVEVCPWNFLNDSEDFASSFYIKEDTTISSNSTTAPNGTTTADTSIPTTANAIHRIQAPFDRISGQEYTFSVYAKASGYNFLYMNAGTMFNARSSFNLSNGAIDTALGTATITNVGNGWYRCSVSGTASASGATVAFLQTNSTTSGASDETFAGNGTSGIFLWGAQLNIGSTAKPYFPTTDRLNVPRLTYQNGGGGCPSLLLEKQSTNIAPYSEDFSNAVWIKSGSTVTAKNKISPDGTQNADTVDFSTGGPIEQLILYAADNLTHTVSCWVKVSSGTSSFRLKMTHAGVANHYSEYFTATTTWQRFTFTQAFGSGGTGFYAGVEGASAVLDLWGFQLEPNTSYVTSYIPTTSASATRVADACFKTGISSLFGTNQGTFFIDLVYYGSEQFSYLFDITDSSNVNRFLMYDSNGSGLFYFYDSGYAVVDFVQLTKGERYKIGVKYNSSGTIWYVNGVLKGTGTVSFAHQMSQIYLGIRYSITDNSGIKVNESIVFPTALTSTELASLTTI